MSTTKNILEFFSGLRPGQTITANAIIDQGDFNVSTVTVYTTLAALCQPGKPLQRARNVHGIYEYQLRRDVNLKPFLAGDDIDLPAEPKTAAAQAPCRTPASSPGPSARMDSPNGGASAPASPDKSTPAVKPASAAAPRFLPLDNPNPAQAEVVRFIGELRIRRDALDEVINLLETTFGGPKK